MNKLNQMLMSIRTQKEALKVIMENTNDINKKKELKNQIELLRKEELECLKNIGVEL